jgi:hypothetical protein
MIVANKGNEKMNDNNTSNTQPNTNKHHDNNPTRGPLFNDETFDNLKTVLQELRDETKPKSKNFFFEHINQKIYDIKQEIEDAAGAAPSYKTLVNKILSIDNLRKTKQQLIEKIQHENLEGYTPDMQTLANETVNDEIVEKIKTSEIEKFKQLI